MNRFKIMSRRTAAFVMTLVLAMGMLSGMTFTVSAADAIYVSGSTGYFYVKVVDDTTGDSDTLKVNVTASGMKAGDATSTSNRVAFSGSVSSPKLGLKLKASQPHTGFVMSQDGTVSLLMCDLQFTVPAHTSYASVAKDNADNHTFRLCDSVKTPVTGNSSYTDVTVSHNPEAYTKSMVMALNLYECGLRQGHKDVHSTIELHIRRNPYSIAYSLDGGTFKSGKNTTYTETSNGRTQKQNPTTALDGGELSSSYTNPYFRVEYPTKTGYTFKGWDITGMDSDRHYFYTSNGAKYTTATALNTTTNTDAVGSTYIPTSYMNLRATAGTVTFHALYDANRYSVVYDGNGATAGSMANQTHTYDTALNLTMNAYIKTGYTFLGWSRNRDGAEPEFMNGESVKNLTAQADGDVTLYALWQKNSAALNNANVLKNIEKIMKVNIIKTDETDSTKTLNAVFDVYEWSAALNEGHGAYKTVPSFSVNANEENMFKYTPDNLGKFKVKERSVEEPYINNGDEAEIRMNDGIDIPFYENTMAEEDKGVFIMGAGYSEGDIVRDSADLTGASFYRAKVANTGHGLNEGAYWLKLDGSNYSRYDRLVKGAGEWSAEGTYAKTFSMTIGNASEKPENGVIFSLRKKNERGEILFGAKFNVYYSDDNSLCKALNERYDKKGVYASNYDENGDVLSLEEAEIPVDDSQTHAVLNDDGTKTLELVVKEDRAPEDHGKIDDFKVTADIKYNEEKKKWDIASLTATFSDGKTATIDNGGTFDTPELTDESYKLTINVIKKSKDGNYAPADLAGAEYTVYEDEALTLPVTTITIGTDGTGKAEYLPLKDYFVRETKTPDSGKFLFSDEVQTIRASELTGITGQTDFTTKVTFEEEGDSAVLLVHKVDDGGRELDGAQFTLYRCPDGVTEENADSYDYSDVPKTGIEEVTEGYARFKDVPFGRYVLVETKVPDGYKKAPNEIVELTRENGGNTEATAKIVTVVDYKEETRIKIYKRDASDDKKLGGAVFKIYDVDKGTYIMQDVMTLDENGNEAESREEKRFITDKDGLIIADGLSYGTYRIEEVEAPEGYVLDSEPQTIKAVKGSGAGIDSDGIPYFEVNFRDSKTETWLKKTDITTGEELAGGEYTVEDRDGNTIDHWMGDGTTHKIYGLIPGETYTFIEETAPDGYTIAVPVEFTVNEDGTVTEVVMEDDYNKLDLSKCDITTGEEIEGAEMELYDSEGNLIDSWISEKTPHRIERIPVGTYTLVETQAPDGYVTAESITFEVGESSEVQEVVMYDDYTKTEFIKLASDTGEPLPGCVLQVLDKNKNVVEEWTTDGTAHEIYYLTAGETYYLHEVSAPGDYQRAEDIAFVAGEQWADDNSTTEEDYNRMEGTQFTDRGGNTVDWDDGKVDTTEPEDDMEPGTDGDGEDNHQPDGEDGTVEEVELDEIPEEGTYDESAAETVTITMLDKPKLVSIIKKTDAGDLLPGAEMQLLDAEGNILHSWTSGADVASVFKLANGTYTIHEAYAPENYELAEDITFEVTDDTTEAEYEMVDEYTGGSVKVVKTDEGTGKPMEGVEFTLTGENGLTLKEKTDENGEILFGVKNGKNTLPPQKYTLTETGTSSGYSLLKDPVEITLPLKLTEAEAEAMGADISQAKWDKENGVYRFFDLTYEISDGAKLKLPATGSDSLLYGMIAGAAIVLLAGLYLWSGRKKRQR